MPVMQDDLQILVDALLRTLHDEYEMLDAIGVLCTGQLDALRTRRLDQLEDYAMQMSEQLMALGHLHRTRGRQVRSLGGCIGLDGEAPSLYALIEQMEARQMVGAAHSLTQVADRLDVRARTVRRQHQDTVFALQYAADLNRSLIAAVYPAAPQDAPGQTYTAGGQSASAPGRSIISTVG